MDRHKSLSFLSHLFVSHFLSPFIFINPQPPVLHTCFNLKTLHKQKQKLQLPYTSPGMQLPPLFAGVVSPESEQSPPLPKSDLSPLQGNTLYLRVE